MSYTTYLNLTEAASKSPGRPHSATIWRWCRRGVKSRNGDRIRLEHIRAGGKIFIKEHALDEFFTKLAQSDQKHFLDQEYKPLAAPKPRTNKKREKSVLAAKKVLAQAGI